MVDTTDETEQVTASHWDAASSVRMPGMFFAIAAAIVLLAGLLYRPSVHGGMVWDDTFLIKTNGLDGATRAGQCFTRAFLWNYYRPLTGASFVIERGMWHLNTFGYHITNILLHVLTTALIVPLLLVAFRDRRVALVGAALFAVQPIQVSTVAWIGGRTDSLCTLFIALFWLVLIHGARSVGRRRQALLAVSFLCFAAAAASKEQALAMVPLVPLALFVFRPPGEARGRGDGETGRRGDAETANEEGAASSPLPLGEGKGEGASIKEMALWTLPFIGFAVWLMLAWHRYGDPIHPHWNLKFQVPAVGRTMLHYTLLLLTPTPALLHTWTLGNLARFGIAGILVGYGIAVAACLVLVRWLRTRPELGWFFAAGLLLLLPVSNIYPLITQVVAPYRVGTVGLAGAVVVGWALVNMWDRLTAAQPDASRRLLAAAPIVLYFGLLAGLTLWDTSVWNTQLDASLAVERYDPTSTFGTLETAASYLDRGEPNPAIKRLDKILETIHGKTYTVVRSDSAIWWMYGGYPADWIGELYARAGQWELDHGNRPYALELLNKGVQLAPSNELVRAGLANCAFAVKDLDGGIEQLRTLLRYRPKLVDDRIVLARVLMSLKRWPEADAEFTKSLERKPDDKNLYLIIAYTRFQQGNPNGAAQILNAGINRGALTTADAKKLLNSLGLGAMMP